MITRKWLMDEWRDTFLTELRLHEVPGSRIGEALAEVDTHCADSGEDPTEAFGDPIEYAASIARDLPPVRRRTPARQALGHGLIAAATVAGILGLLAGTAGVAHGRPATLTVGELVTIGFAGIGAAALSLLLRPGRQPSRAGGAAIGGFGFAIMIFPQIVGKAVATEQPAWPVLGVGLVLVAVTWWPLLSDRFFADRVVDPRTGTEPFRVPRLALGVIRWAPPMILLVAVAAAVLLPGAPR